MNLLHHCLNGGTAASDNIQLLKLVCQIHFGITLDIKMYNLKVEQILTHS
jgi:hypothetical protein